MEIENKEILNSLNKRMSDIENRFEELLKPPSKKRKAPKEKKKPNPLKEAIKYYVTKDGDTKGFYKLYEISLHYNMSPSTVNKILKDPNYKTKNGGDMSIKVVHGYHSKKKLENYTKPIDVDLKESIKTD